MNVQFIFLYSELLSPLFSLSVTSSDLLYSHLPWWHSSLMVRSDRKEITIMGFPDWWPLLSLSTPQDVRKRFWMSCVNTNSPQTWLAASCTCILHHLTLNMSGVSCLSFVFVFCNTAHTVSKWRSDGQEISRNRDGIFTSSLMGESIELTLWLLL